MIKPTIFPISQGFGPYSEDVQKQFGLTFHYGVDFACPRNSPVIAPEDGGVSSIITTDGGGNWLIIDHADGIQTAFCHLNDYNCKVGDIVKQGQTIAYSGNTGKFTTGPHLHMEVWQYGVKVNPELFFNDDEMKNADLIADLAAETRQDSSRDCLAHSAQDNHDYTKSWIVNTRANNDEYIRFSTAFGMTPQQALNQRDASVNDLQNQLAEANKTMAVKDIAIKTLEDSKESWQSQATNAIASAVEPIQKLESENMHLQTQLNTAQVVNEELLQKLEEQNRLVAEMQTSNPFSKVLDWFFTLLKNKK